MNVIFDVGNVLVDVVPSKRLKQLNEAYYHDEKMIKAFCDPSFWVNFDLHIIENKDDAIKLFTKMYPMYEKQVKEFFEGVWQAYYEANKVGETLFKECLEKGCHVYILSNFFQLAFDYILNRFTFINKADGIMVSYQIGLCKPDEKAFNCLIDKYHLDIKDTVFIDDSQINIDGAKKVGLKTILFDNDLEGIRKQLWN